jgi:hypothetical protein
MGKGGGPFLLVGALIVVWYLAQVFALWGWVRFFGARHAPKCRAPLGRCAIATGAATGIPFLVPSVPLPIFGGPLLFF